MRERPHFPGRRPPCSINGFAKACPGRPTWRKSRRTTPRRNRPGFPTKIADSGPINRSTKRACRSQRRRVGPQSRRCIHTPQARIRGIAPVAAADARSLIRRTTLRSHGLPPTPEEVAAFEAAYQGAGAEAAYEALLDRLLASPHYGEKWGRHWLDLVRTPNRTATKRDSAKPFAWRYRDYVINSLNADKPYDQFLREQNSPATNLPSSRRIRSRPPASTASALGTTSRPTGTGEVRILDGIVSTTSSVILGMSVGCARCHDHKRDPISQRDYYKLLDCFRDVTDMNREKSAPLCDARRTASLRRATPRQGTSGSDLASGVGRARGEIPRRGAVARHRRRGNRRRRLVRTPLSTLSRHLEVAAGFRRLKAETVGQVPGNRISLAVASRAEAIGLVFEGKLRVPQDGQYTFAANMREGFRLTIDGQPSSIARNRRPMKRRSRSRSRPDSFPCDSITSTPRTRRRCNSIGAGGLLDAATDRRRRGRRTDRRGRRLGLQTGKAAEGLEPTDFNDGRWARGPAGFGTRGTPGAEIGNRNGKRTTSGCAARSA